MVKFTWYNAEVPAGMKVRQVQGLIFTRDGRMLIKSEIIDGKKVYSLGGGTPEDYDVDREATLRRELLEEVNTTIFEPYYVGYQTVEGDGDRPTYAQIRMTAIIDTIGESIPDPDSGTVYERLLTTPDRAIELLNWDTGEPQIRAAVRVAREKLGITSHRDFDEIV